MLKRLEAVGFQINVYDGFDHIFMIEYSLQKKITNSLITGRYRAVTSKLCFRTFVVPCLCQQHASGSKIKSIFICLMYQHRDVEDIEKQLNKDFENVSDWFVDNKFSIHFGEDKTKSILFASKRKIKSARKLNVKYKIQHSQVTYLGCVLDETLCGEPMALKALNKINGKLKFLYRKNEFLTPTLRRMLSNAIMKPHFDYVCSAWYPNLYEKLKKKKQVTRKKCIWFCLKLDKRHHISSKDFE